MTPNQGINVTIPEIRAQRMLERARAILAREHQKSDPVCKSIRRAANALESAAVLVASNDESAAALHCDIDQLILQLRGVSRALLNIVDRASPNVSLDQLAAASIVEDSNLVQHRLDGEQEPVS